MTAAITTASITALRHPEWCSPAECLAGSTAGVHLSAPATAYSARTGLTVSVQLVQARPLDGLPGGQTLVSLVIHYPDEGPGHPAREYPFVLEHGFARTVGWMLRHAGPPPS